MGSEEERTGTGVVRKINCGMALVTVLVYSDRIELN